MEGHVAQDLSLVPCVQPEDPLVGYRGLEALPHAGVQASLGSRHQESRERGNRSPAHAVWCARTAPAIWTPSRHRARLPSASPASESTTVGEKAGGKLVRGREGRRKA
eukprot:762812-Hanusia_phi.AAC.10